jgi:hypothetical protein
MTPEDWANKRRLSPHFPTAEEAALRLHNARCRRFARGCLIVMIAAVLSATLDGIGRWGVIVFAFAVIGYAAVHIFDAVRHGPRG